MPDQYATLGLAATIAWAWRQAHGQPGDTIFFCEDNPEGWDWPTMVLLAEGGEQVMVCEVPKPS